jgi:hypothetical protein
MCELLTGSRTLSQLADSRIDPHLIELIERATKSDPIYRFKTARHFLRALADISPKQTDDHRVLARLIAQMRATDENSPDAIVPQTGGSGGNYFETIATLAKKKHSTSPLADPAPSAPAQPIPIPPPLPAAQPRSKSWFQRLFRS